MVIILFNYVSLGFRNSGRYTASSPTSASAQLQRRLLLSHHSRQETQCLLFGHPLKQPDYCLSRLPTTRDSSGHIGQTLMTWTKMATTRIRRLLALGDVGERLLCPTCNATALRLLPISVAETGSLMPYIYNWASQNRRQKIHLFSCLLQKRRDFGHLFLGMQATTWRPNKREKTREIFSLPCEWYQKKYSLFSPMLCKHIQTHWTHSKHICSNTLIGLDIKSQNSRSQLRLWYHFLGLLTNKQSIQTITHKRGHERFTWFGESLMSMNQRVIYSLSLQEWDLGLQVITYL